MSQITENTQRKKDLEELKVLRKSLSLDDTLREVTVGAMRCFSV